jgi:hypothetical protein
MSESDCLKVGPGESATGEQTEKKGGSKTWIVGVVLAIILCVAVVLLILILFHRRRKRGRSTLGDIVSFENSVSAQILPAPHSGHGVAAAAAATCYDQEYDVIDDAKVPYGKGINHHYEDPDSLKGRNIDNPNYNSMPVVVSRAEGSNNFASRLDNWPVHTNALPKVSNFDNPTYAAPSTETVPY